MPNTARIARWVVGLIIVAVVGALLGWYYFLRSTADQTASLAASRGLQDGAPAFTGTTGSTNANIVQSMQAQGNAGFAASSTFSTKDVWEVSSTPIAGASFSATGALIYVERSTGYVFSADPATHSIVRLTNTLRPKVYQAFIASQGRIIERTIAADGSVVNFIGQIAAPSATSSESSLLGTNLEGQVESFAVNAAGGAYVYALAQPRGGIVGITSNWSGTKQQRVFTSPLTGWNMWYLSDGRIVLSQKAADGVAGYAYEVGKNGSFSQIAQGLGLTVLPRASSTALLIGTSAGNGALALTALASAKTAPTALAIATPADKCAWAPGTSLVAYCAVPGGNVSGTFLDDWYRGAVHTSDSWWKIDVLSGSSTPLSIIGPSHDVLGPVIDPTGTHIAYENASDGTLWLLTIPN